jgi:hypothetical protein
MVGFLGRCIARTELADVDRKRTKAIPYIVCLRGTGEISGRCNDLSYRRKIESSCGMDVDYGSVVGDIHPTMQEIEIDRSSIVGAKLEAASSSLKNFAIKLPDGRGISIEARDVDGDPEISVSLVKASELPKLNEAVCSVDWSWIVGSTVSDITVSAKMVRFSFDPAGPLNVSVGTWQGSPFLSFQPFRPSK